VDEPGSVIDTLVPRVPESGIHSRTLHSSPDAKVVHFAFAAGEELSEHAASRPATIQVISGSFELSLAGELVDAGPGVWVYMERGLAHALRALEPSTMLLTLIGPAVRP
jgi:quercetin dioxygenase-like cupin family protein